jgi:pheromone shutdown protein TraB
MYAHTLLLRGIFKTTGITSSWTSEYNDFIDTLHTRGGEAFAESLDRSRINFLVNIFSRACPKQKKILIDKREERIFNEIYKMKDHKNIVAVVNQWHMEGVETHWRRLTGT